MPVEVRKNKKDADAPIGKIVFFGKKVTGNQRASLVRASISMTIDRVSEMEFNLSDQGFEELQKGFYVPGIPVRYEEDMMTEIASVDLGSEGGHPMITVRCRPRVVRKLKKRRGQKVIKSASPTDFVRAECKAVGAKVVAQSSGQRRQVARDTKRKKGDAEAPSSWTTFKRLAGECGFVLFEARGTIYFGKPTWLMDKFKEDALEVNWGKGDSKTRPLYVPNCTRSVDTKEDEVTVTFELPWSSHARKFRPGKAIKLGGVPTYNGHYLIKTVEYSLLEPATISVEAGTPIDPEKVERPMPKAGGRGSTPAEISGGGVSGGRKSAGLFVTYALRQAGDAYIYGAEASLSDADPNAFDCSELVQWAAARAGVYIPDGSASQIAYCRSISVSQAIRTRGALLYHPGHIAISLGNGRTIEAANPGFGVGSLGASGRFTRGGLIPGMRY